MQRGLSAIADEHLVYDFGTTWREMTWSVFRFERGFRLF